MLFCFVVSVACGGRSVRYDESDDGRAGSEPRGTAGTIGVGGSAPFVNDAGAGTLGGTAGTSVAAGVAGRAELPPDPPDDPEPCDPDADPLDPASGNPCTPAQPQEDECDQVARKYEFAVGAAQWCEADAECRAGHLVASTLRCGCDVVVRTLSDIAPLAAQWRAQGCLNHLPCSASCLPASAPYRCGEAGFCLPTMR